MDKFGIFNLLNSFLNPSSNVQDQNSSSNSNQNSQDGSSPTDLIGGILNSLKGSNSENKPTLAPTKPVERQTDYKPLQRQMLSTISFHDELIRRINSSPPKR